MENTKELWKWGDACNEIKDPPTNRNECGALLVEVIKDFLLDEAAYKEVLSFEKDEMTIFVRDATHCAYPNTRRLHNASFYRLVSENLKWELV